MSKIVLPIFFSKNLTFRFLIHLDFIFVYGVRECPNFIFFTCGYPVFPASLIEETFFLHNSKRQMHSNIHCSTVYNSEDMEAT